jgi:hypothetical protein
VKLPIVTDGVSEISITDISGKVIFARQNCQQHEKIDLSIYPAGLYFMKFSTIDHIIVEKFIKN